MRPRPCGTCTSARATAAISAPGRSTSTRSSRRSDASATTAPSCSSRSPRPWSRLTSAACSASGATSGRTTTNSGRTRTPTSATSSWRSTPSASTETRGRFEIKMLLQVFPRRRSLDTFRYNLH
ncbi:exported protein of unknown function [Microbacterium sp. Nx66]|nr:exported protein of unknown function [Microbacterium sp. Nx66]